ncbi:conserved exported protein of unknown function [Candidatus Methylopumilus turicensis]|uniref:SOUL heme-binding protein n=2 Tax=Candidatus Methylopumilus turicensis TaxID=1581680 RepID=A0A0B7IVQ6_9PROT|nr:conserved exported protein of unknown function [Candidatus Methylopumilus turicensis]
MLLWTLVLLLFSNITMATEEPKFELLEKDQSFELRMYEPKIHAEVIVTGNMREASSKGFRMIADFIFGDNVAISGQSEKISMTAPVLIEPRPEKISMTAPVVIEQSSAGWRVNFVMPSQYTLATLPKPNNSLVKIKSVPAKKFAVIRFSGLVDEEKMSKKVSDLEQWINSKQLKVIGNAELARYNPPWTLPFLRRNEVLIEVE